MLGSCSRTRWISFILLLLVSWGLLATETHAILGHPHEDQACPGQQIGIVNTSSGPELTRLKAEREDPFCGICLSYRLLRHSLIPAMHCIVASMYVIQPISVHPVSLIQTESPQEENRGPPIA